MIFENTLPSQLLKLLLEFAKEEILLLGKHVIHNLLKILKIEEFYQIRYLMW